MEGVRKLVAGLYVPGGAIAIQAGIGTYEF